MGPEQSFLIGYIAEQVLIVSNETGVMLCTHTFSFSFDIFAYLLSEKEKSNLPYNTD